MSTQDKDSRRLVHTTYWKRAAGFTFVAVVRGKDITDVVTATSV